MEIIKDGIYWQVKNTHGPVPNVLKGEWTSFEAVRNAISAYKQTVHSKALNVSERTRQRKERAANNQQVSD